MQHENARNGVGKLFTAEILLIVSVFCSLLTLIPVVGTIIGGLAIAVLGIIAFILQLVGLSKAGQDSDQIKSAFMWVIIGLIVSIVMAIFAGIWSDATWIQSIGKIVNFIISLLVTYNVLFGCAGLNSALSERAESTWKFYMIVIIIEIVVTIVLVILTLIGLYTAMAVIAVIFVLVDVVLQLIAYFKYLGFLKQAKDEV